MSENHNSSSQCLDHLLHPGYNHPLSREWQQMNTQLSKTMLVYPIFVVDEEDAKQPIKSMPEQFQLGINRLEEFLTPLIQRGLRSVLLFGVLTKPGRKDERGSAISYTYTHYSTQNDVIRS
jgi:porphobilinogen synthase